MRIANLALVHSTAEYCAPAWCHSAHTHQIDVAINSVLRTVTGCLRPTPTDNLPILAGIQPAEFRRKQATLSLSRRALEPDHLLHAKLFVAPIRRQTRLKSRRPFVSAAQLLVKESDNLNISAAHWADQKWSANWKNNSTRLRTIIPDAEAHIIGTQIPRTAWVRLNRLRTGIGRFCSNTHKWGVAPSAACECGAEEQTTDHIIVEYPILRAPCGPRGLRDPDDNTIKWLLDTCPNI